MDVTEFYQALKRHCQWQSKGNGENCRQCRFREFCFTPPIDLSSELVAQIQKDLEDETVAKASSASAQKGPAIYINSGRVCKRRRLFYYLFGRKRRRIE